MKSELNKLINYIEIFLKIITNRYFLCSDTNCQRSVETKAILNHRTEYFENHDDALIVDKIFVTQKIRCGNNFEMIRATVKSFHK